MSSVKKVILRDFQIDAVNKLCLNEKTYNMGSVLAYDMGLGKTLIMSDFLIKKRNEEIPEFPDLIVVPPAVLLQWKTEILRIDDTKNIFIYHGPNRVSEFKSSKDKVDIVITTYHSFVTRELECYKWNRVVLDEAHIIRNGIENKYTVIPKKVIGAYAMINISKYRYCITGTPFNNRINDILSLMKFIDCKEYDVKNFVNIFVLQKTKEGLLDPIETEIIYIDRPLNGLSEYNRLSSKYYYMLSLSRNSNIIQSRNLYQQSMMLLMKLRVFCDLMKESTFNNVIIEENEYEKIYENIKYTKEEEILFYDNSIKIKTVCDKLFDSITKVHKNRIIVFSCFITTLDILESITNEKCKDILTFQYNGKKNVNERKFIVDAFTNEDETRPMILFISLGAGSSGLNLTPCSTVFLVDVSLNPFESSQAINRVHRITQTEKVTVTKFCMKNMIEENILKLHSKKFDDAKNNGLIFI